ncbi:MAG: DUF4249 domain-containing protein [Aureispira sp.]|nr:DUF4249 domain-containing protein [Aureispira sp.]
MYKFINFILISILAGLVLSCDSFERDIDIELPEIEKELVVECYLQPGQPYRVILTETKSYFENLQACPFVQGATVVIEHNGVRDTLTEASIYLPGSCDDSTLSIPINYPILLNTRFANYGSTKICPKDYNSDFKLEIHDHINNRVATAVTRILPPVPLTEIKTEFDEAGEEAYALVSAQDDGSQVNFYRLMLHEGELADNSTFPPTANNPEFDAVIDDARFFNGKLVALGTSYKFSEGDTLIATIYHIDKTYHDYLETARDAQSNNGNPFGQPGTILTNIDGGQGVFTSLSYDRDTVIVSK